MILDSMLGHHAVLLVAASLVVAGVYLVRQMARAVRHCLRGGGPSR